MAKVSVNLVTWNGERYVLDCLKALFNQTYKDYTLLIIDNFSTDNTVEVIREKYPQLKIVEHRENNGFVKAHNQAIHWTKSEYVLMLNQDIVLEPCFLEKLANFMDCHPQAGAVTGKLMSWQNKQKTNYIDSAGMAIYKNHRVVDLGSGEMDSGQFDTEQEIFGVSGAAPMFRRQALEDVAEDEQFLDEDFWIYKEDIDLAYRLRWRGWQAWRMPKAIAYHDRSVSGLAANLTDRQIASNRKQKPQFANFHSYRNHWYLLMKNVPKLSWRIRLYEIKKFLYILFAEQSSLRAIKEIRQNKKKFLEKKKNIMDRKKVEFAEIEKWFM